MAEYSAEYPTEVRGSAYGHPAATFDREICEVGPGTLGGEFLRRYWHPFALSNEVTSDLPTPVRLLGEDLIAYRDLSGDLGLIYPRCMHRGTSLLFGKIEQTGIRCPYHGWQFDTCGRLIDTPCEIKANSSVKKTVRQPWYPVIEQYGLVFAFMGPIDKMPKLPVFPQFANLCDDEEVAVTGGLRPATGAASLFTGPMDFNWFQCYENFMDPMHLGALHSTINGAQLQDDLHGAPSPCKFKENADGSGLSWIGHWPTDDGKICQLIFQSLVPNIVMSNGLGPGLAGVQWIVPVDDTNHRWFNLRRQSTGQNYVSSRRSQLGMLQPEWGPGKPYDEWGLEDHQRWQTDYIVQKAQGDITLHSEEHLTSADKGVFLTRRIFKTQAERVRAGQDPVAAAPNQAFQFDLIGGTCMLDAQTGAVLEGVANATLADY